jgi:glycosyltransferase involved in cell wall biosynthesis
MPQLWRRLPEIKLLLVGNNPADWMRALDDDRIEVTGRVSDVQPYLARATAFVCPLRIGAGMKNKVLEALAIGIPLVATPLSIDGIAARHGHSVIVAEVSEFADAVLALLDDETLRLQLSQRGRELVESEYTWERAASRYEGLFDAITSV